MLTIKKKESGKVEAIISGSLSREDIRKLKEALKMYVQQKSTPDLLLAVRNFRGWYGGGPWWSDLTLAEECGCPMLFRRIALVGDSGWKVWMQRFAGSMAFEEAKFFDPKEQTVARDWLATHREARDGKPLTSN